ncbi:hypothetical protein HEK131_24910 [Streptomyces seoulensis]|nr:hypothetical protein HEK131_24910 [Streptomyces seoulensis]
MNNARQVLRQDWQSLLDGDSGTGWEERGIGAHVRGAIEEHRRRFPVSGPSYTDREDRRTGISLSPWSAVRPGISGDGSDPPGTLARRMAPATPGACVRVPP